MITREICIEIYKEEIDTNIKTLKRFKEAWQNHSFRFNDELFKYADDDFYFYRFAIGREEESTVALLNRIICRLMHTYEVDFETPKDGTFDYIVTSGSRRFGYRYEEFFVDEDINDMLNQYKISTAYIIRTTRRNNKYIERANQRYSEEGINVKEITLKDLFEMLFSIDEYDVFETYIDNYVKQARNILGYKSIKVLSKMNLSARKAFEEDLLLNWDYENAKYQIIDPENELIEDYIDIADFDFSQIWKYLKSKYIEKELYKSLVGTCDFAESFITAEWLYYSLKDEKNFDYTSIVSGYLKSIEQLLYELVMINIDNDCVISLKRDKKVKKLANKNKVQIFEIDKESLKREKVCNPWQTSFPYIDFTSEQKDYMDSSIGTFEYFLRYNPNIFVDSGLSDVIVKMVSCFRVECRNGYFHTHNLRDMSIVDKTRENAILLYAVLLGCIKQSEFSKDKLGISNENRFDEVCKIIREISHYKPNFIFEYNDGTKKKMIYDMINNIAEYAEDGTEHYDRLGFFEVSDFTLETYEQLDTEMRNEWQFYLTENNLPARIYCTDIRGNNHEVPKELLQ